MATLEFEGGPANGEGGVGAAVGRLADADVAFSAGSLREASKLLSSLSLDTLESHDVVRALALQCRVAFRSGFHREAVELAQRFLRHPAAEHESVVPFKLDALAILILSAAELCEFETAVSRMPDLASVTGRRHDLVYWVRGRGTAASLLCMLDDPWAARRVLDHLAAVLSKSDHDKPFAFTVFNNIASVNLGLARSARDSGDQTSAIEALEHALAAIAQARAVAERFADQRMLGMCSIHDVERRLLGGEPGSDTHSVLAQATTQAAQGGSTGLQRHLCLLTAETLLAAGRLVQALSELTAAQTLFNDGTETMVRIRQHRLLAKLHVTLNGWESAFDHEAQARALEQCRQWRIGVANSHKPRLKLELEHLFLAKPPRH